jgi:hypothetical protein
MKIEKYFNGQDYHDERIRERLERQAYQRNESDEQNREWTPRAPDMQQFGAYTPTGRRRRPRISRSKAR